MESNFTWEHGINEFKAFRVEVIFSYVYINLVSVFCCMYISHSKPKKGN